MTNWFISSSLIVITLLTACTPQGWDKNSIRETQPPAGIVDGTLVTENDPLLKRVVLIHVALGPDFFRTCTATPISRTVLLTAAHCLTDATEVKAFFGSSASAPADFDYFFQSDNTADKIISHEKYKPTEPRSSYDIGLIKLKNPIPPDYKVSELYEFNDTISDGRVTFIGYGKTGFNQEDEGTLRKVTKSRAGLWVSNAIVSFKSSICPGDSGGPSFVNVEGSHKIFSITIAVNGIKGTDLCRNNNFALYVPYHRAWIEKAMRKLNPEQL